ncbi:MAG: hypothetical protein R2757_12135 [Draconibacterium sp.]
MDPSKAQPTYHPVLTSFRPNCDATLPMVPEITAVSYPKSPGTATDDRKITYPGFLLFSLLPWFWLLY